MVLKGIPVSPGIAIEKIHIHSAVPAAVEKALFRGPAAPALERLRAALGAAGEEVSGLCASFSEKDGDRAKIFQAHLELLQDEDILDELFSAVEESRFTPEYAVFSVYSSFEKLLSESPDENIALRAADLADLRERLLRLLRGGADTGLSGLDGPVILAAEDLLPSQTALLDPEKIRGIVTGAGGASSHTAILASALGIPAAVGVAGVPGVLKEGERAGLDGISGLVYPSPDENTLSALREKKRVFDSRREAEKKFLSAPAQTADGTRIFTGINIGSPGSPGDYEHCDFVGLFRTEFLYMESSGAPTEEEQFLAYRRVLENAGGRPVTLRTLDIGGDKTLEYMPLPEEENPALGLRGLRLCLDRPGLFRTQLCAALRASAHGKLMIMLPMAGGIEDVAAGRAALEAAKAELRGRGESFDPDVKFGVMIEVPAAALMAEEIAKTVDFASIGTNDLCQYTCAADRQNPAAAGYYRSFSPAMARLISRVCRAFDRIGKPLSVCGEMAGDKRGAALLIGLGLRRLSMSPAKLAGVRAAISGLPLSVLRDGAEKALLCETQEQVGAILDGFFPPR